MKHEMIIHDAEMKLMNLIWEVEPVKAKELAALAWGELGWKITTTYTVLKRLCDRGVIQRNEPEFIITSLISKSQITKEQVNRIVNRLFNGSCKLFLASFLEEEKLTSKDISEIRILLDDFDKKTEV